MWRASRILAGFIGGAIALLVGGTLLTEWTVHRADREMREALLQRTRTVARAITTDHIMALSGDPSDALNPVYRRLKKQLAIIKSTYNEGRFIYLFGRRSNGTIFFYIDNEPEGAPGYSPPGQEYPEATDPLRLVFDKREAATEGPVNDRWGTWMSALVPIANPQTGEVTAVLGIDVGASTWTNDLVRAGLPPVLLTLSLLAILSAGALILHRRCRYAGTPPRWMLPVEPALVLAVGLTVTVYAAWTLDSRERRARGEAFALLAAGRADTAMETLRTLRHTRLEGLAALFQGSEDVFFEEFLEYTQYLTKDPDVEAWGWCPAVSAAEKADFEAEFGAAGGTRFEIWQKDAKGAHVPASGRDVYYPVAYVAGSGGSSDLRGFDFGSDPIHRAALEDAVRSRRPSATEPILRAPNSAMQKRLFFYRPVYRKGRPGVLDGFVWAAVPMEKLLRRPTQDGSTLLEIALLRENGVTETLASDTPGGVRRGAEPSFISPVFAFGKVFAANAYPGARFLRLHPARAGWFAALTGILLSAGLALVASLVIRRRVELERLVAERTLHLRDSEERLSATLRSIGDGVIACDREGRVAHLNQVAEKLTGWSSAEAVGQPIESVFRIVHVRTRATIPSPVVPSLREGAPAGLDEQAVLIARDGAEYTVADSCAPIRGGNGAVLGSVLVFRDITEEHRRREELAEERKRIEHILGITGTKIDVINAEFDLHYVDPMTQQIYGNPAGRKCYKYYMGTESPCAACGIPQALETRQPVVTEQILPRENDRVVEVHTIPFQGPDGRWLAAQFKVDITERKLEQETLLRTQFTLDRASDSVIWVGESGEVIYANDAACSSMGYTREELLAMTVFDLDPDFPFDNWEAHKAEMRRLGSITFESRHRRKDGTTFPVEVSSNHFEYQGRFMACAFDRDITRRKQAEEVLREKAALLEAQSHATIDGILIVGPNQKRLAINRRMIELFQVPPDVLENDDDTPLLNHVVRFVKNPESFMEKVEYLYNNIHETSQDEIELKNGMLLDRYSAPVLGEDGRYYGRIWIMRDVTARKRAEEAIEKRLMALVRPLDDPEGIDIEDLFNLQDLQRLQDEFARATGVASIITHPNGAPITRPSNFSRLCSKIVRQTELGRANCACSDALIGRASSDGPTVQPCLSAGLWDAGAGISIGGRHIANWLIGQVRDETIAEEHMREYARTIGADEADFMAAFREVTPMSQARFKEVAQVLYTLARQLSDFAYQNVQQARFITEHQRAEEEREKLQGQLSQAQKMESVGRLAGGVAHDFNNMLSVILGNADLALCEMDPAEPLYLHLEEIRKAAERSADLTRQLLAFARKQTVKPRVLDLNETVEGMIKMLGRLIGEDIAIAWIPGENVGRVRMDPSQIDQILANLCVNARDAIGDTGKVTIETGVTRFDEAYCADHPGFVPGEFALIAVSDNGCGMEPEMLSHLFEPFFTTKEMGKGTGLGLATVYGIVKQNDGFINVYSEPNHGTTFKIYLPRYLDSRESIHKETHPAAVAPGQETILLVEDEPAILAFITTSLQRLGYNVVAAASPREAIERATTQAGEINLLITDVIMPEMNGRDLARRLLALYPGLRRLFMSGYTADVIAHHGVLDEGVQFMEKPFTQRELAAKVREVLDA